MRKRFAGWGIAIVSAVALVFLLTMIRGGRTTYEDVVVSKDHWYEMMAQRDMADDRLIDTVRFNKEGLLTAQNGMEWYYSLMTRRVSAYNPEIEYQGKDGVKIAILEDRITDELIEQATKVKVMAYTNDEYEIYELVCTTLPVMKIRHTGALELTTEEGEETMDIELFDNSVGATRRYILTGGKIRARGIMAASFPKKSFRMKLRTTSVGENKRPDNTMLLDMRQDDDWILYAGYNDQEKVRNVMATNLWKAGQARNNEFGVDNGVEYKYVELIMNDKYHGLYALGYPVDEIQLGLRSTIMNGFEEFSFKKAVWGGIDTYELKTEVKEPKVAWEELKKFYDIVQTGQDAQKIREMTDMRNAVDMHLFAELVLNLDMMQLESMNVMDGELGEVQTGDTKNIYVTAKKKDGKYIWMYTPWDLDLTFGNMWTEEIALNQTSEYGVDGQGNHEVTGDVVRRLKIIGDDKIRDELSNRYKELRMGVWSDEKIREMISVYETEIYDSGAFRRDRERWPDGNYNEDWEKLSVFRDYVLNRLKAMDVKYL